jgi:hypothetical protein
VERRACIAGLEASIEQAGEQQAIRARSRTQAATLQLELRCLRQAA